MNSIYQKTVIILITALFIGSSFLSIQARPNNPSPETQTYSCGYIPLPSTVIPDTQPTNLDDDVPMEWNWQDATYNNQHGNWMTPVKKQGDCGSCWAFATIGILESMINIQKGYPNIDIDLSEQHLVSCVPGCTCRGGNPHSTLEYLEQNGGAIPESCFPYEGIDENGCDYYNCNEEPVLCQYKCDDWMEHTIPVSDYTYYSSPPASLIKHTVVNHGPVVTTMRVYSDFNYYRDGIYKNHTGTFVGNHAIVIVGYNESQNYWICKNSWSRIWGEKGYFRIDCNECGIGRYIFYADIDPSSLNFPPIADAGKPYHATTNQNINFDSTNSFDMDNNIISYHWNFGDQTTSTLPNPTHSYSSKGIYNVSLTVTDTEGEQSTDNSASFIDLWSIGDSWTYDIDFTTIPNILEPPITLSCELSSQDIEVQVTDETTDTYTLDFDNDIDCTISFEYDFPSTPFDLKLQGTTNKASIQGNLDITKAGFGIKETNYHIHGRVKLILTTPIIPIPIRIPTTFDIDITKTYDTPRPMLGIYPALNNAWHLPSTTSSTSFSFSTLFGLISKSYTEDTIPERDITLKCTEEKTITIQNNPYTAYGISNPSQSLKYYYIPAINNIAEIQSLEPDFYNLYINLKSSNIQ